MNSSTGYYINYSYDLANEVSQVLDSNNTPLVTIGYDNLGQRTSISRANGVTTTYGFDSGSNLTSLSHDLAGSAADVTISLSYNPAGQIISRSLSNSSYAWGGAYTVNRPYTANALNQTIQSGSANLSYNASGTLANDGSSTFSYDGFNRLIGTSGATSSEIQYDGLGRIYESAPPNGYVRFRSHDDDPLNEIDGNYNVLRSYVFGPGDHEAMIWYEGSGTSTRRWLLPDERGSIIAVTNDAGSAIAINTYDEYGIPASGNLGRFQYTGQMWLAEAGLYHFKARAYSPTLGKFMQPDPSGYFAGPNLYAYTAADPINRNDPTGLEDISYSPGMGSGGSITVYPPRVGIGGIVGVGYYGPKPEHREVARIVGQEASASLHLNKRPATLVNTLSKPAVGFQQRVRLPVLQDLALLSPIHRRVRSL